MIRIGVSKRVYHEVSYGTLADAIQETFGLRVDSSEILPDSAFFDFLNIILRSQNAENYKVINATDLFDDLPSLPWVRHG